MMIFTFYAAKTNNSYNKKILLEILVVIAL